jgi:D-alanyl-D-alanine dipeptidase
MLLTGVFLLAVTHSLIMARPVIAEAKGLPAHLVYLRDIDPTILQDMRYATANNFTGQPVPGYEAAQCVLHRNVAEALARAQKILAGQGLSLMVYDCYRPERAVRAFEAWAADGRVDPLTNRFHPRLPKAQLFALGYIAHRSEHSRGTAVDLTIVSLPAAEIETFVPGRMYGDCTDAKEARAPDRSLDMGTGYDCLDTLSHTAAPEITAEQRSAREKLLAALTRQGLRNYAREWWHFSLPTDEPSPAFDFPIRDGRP